MPAANGGGTLPSTLAEQEVAGLELVGVQTDQVERAAGTEVDDRVGAVVDHQGLQLGWLTGGLFPREHAASRVRVRSRKEVRGPVCPPDPWSRDRGREIRSRRWSRQ